jgi:site-specific recombinase XerD
MSFNKPLQGIKILELSSIVTASLATMILCDMAGLTDITIHSMRHDFCTQLVKKGIDIYTVQRLAGHADIRTTMRYVHALEKKDFEALEDLHDFN